MEVGECVRDTGQCGSFLSSNCFNSLLNQPPLLRTIDINTQEKFLFLHYFTEGRIPKENPFISLHLVCSDLF
jgi:hypothetical protein